MLNVLIFSKEAFQKLCKSIKDLLVPKGEKNLGKPNTKGRFHLCLISLWTMYTTVYSDKSLLVE